MPRVRRPVGCRRCSRDGPSSRGAREHQRGRAVGVGVVGIGGLGHMAVKLARARVGQQKRAQHIRDNLVAIIAAQKKAQTDSKDAAAADKQGKK